MKAHKVFNVLMALFFCLVISAPLLNVNRTSGSISSTENRVLAAFPDFRNSTGSFNTHFIKEFENWFNDNLGFRDKLAFVNTKMQYELFGKLTKTDTMIGKNNWLFYVTPEILKDYQHLNLPSEQQLSTWANSLDSIDKYLKTKNIPFITMLNLDKKTIYPEFYPGTILKVGNTSRTDLIEEYFTKHTTLDFFTPKTALMQAKNNATVYSPRFDNAHWNTYGAFVGYTELMKRVSNYYPNIKVLTWDDINVSKYNREIKIYNAVSFVEEDYSLSLINKATAIQTNGILDKLNLLTSNMSVSYRNNNSNYPKALVLGDSYLYGFLTPFLAESFSELNFIYTANMDKIKQYIELFKPDIVIYENVERSFEGTMNILSKSLEASKDYNSYKELPIVNEQPRLWVDSVNNELLQDQSKITIDKFSPITNIIGWAVDSKVNDVAENVFLKIGNQYYTGNYGIARTSVSDYFKNKNLINSGFSFVVNSEEAIQAGQVSIIIISKDKKYQYLPVNIKVEVK